MMPINIVSYLNLLESKFTNIKPTTEDLAQMVGMVYDFTEKHSPYFYLNEIQERAQSRIPVHLLNASRFIQIYIRSVLTSTTGLTKINPDLLKSLFDVIRVRFISALVDYGSAIGVIAGNLSRSAHSIYVRRS